ncbi:MAG: metal-dependent hydrolase [Arcobacteraceae bacterium]|nr:metal-dependent hydrolase [Arcobacteraceae bacterium]
MTIKGHILLSTNLFLTTSLWLSIHNDYPVAQVLFFYLFFLMGVVFVDIDEPNSWIGKRLFFLSYPFKLINITAKILLWVVGIEKKEWHRFFEHRGLTHMLLFVFILYLVSYYLFRVNMTMTSYIVASFGFGVLTHQLGDVLTNTGIKNYFFPFFIGKNFKAPITFSTGGYIEIIFNSCLLFLFIIQSILFLKAII